MAAPAAVAASAELGGYSTEIIMRPRVIPKGWFEVLGSLDAYQTVDSAAKSTLGLGLGGMVRYGAAPNLDVGVGYGLALKPFDAGSDFSAQARYALIPDPSLPFTASATLDVHRHGGVALGFDAHYKFSRSVELFTSRQLVLDYGSNQVTSDDYDGDQVTAAVFLPVAVGVALTPHVYLFGDTTLASLGINPSESSFIFSDYISLTAGAYYSPTNKLDLGLVVDSPDVGTFEDNFAVSAVAQVRM